MQLNDSPLLLTLDQVSKKLNIGRTAFYQLRQSGQFAPTVYRLGGKLLVRASELSAWVSDGMPPATQWNKSTPISTPIKQISRPVANTGVICSLRGGRQ
jgi:predicted DNA-binding transcriptional regulator AlpA